MHVAFHFNVADPIDYISRLVRKVRAKNLTLVICARPSDVEEIDQKLWSLSPEAFLPHAVQGSRDEVWARSPVLLCSEITAQHKRQVLVNLGQMIPEIGKQFERIVDIVATDEASRAAARQRWRDCVARGLVPERHDVAAAPGQ